MKTGTAQLTRPEDMTELLKKREPLDPELAEHLEDSPFGPCVKHPLIFSVPHHDDMNALINFQLKHRKEAVREALENGEHDRYVIMHERPFRLEAAVRIGANMREEEFYELLGDVWIDTENVYQHASIWRTLLRNREAVQHMMTAEERATLEQMPDTVTVYRGVNRHGDPCGLSWTTSRETAEWFANRFRAPDSNPRVFTVNIPKDRITAYLARRDESEVILCPPPKLDELTVVSENG